MTMLRWLWVTVIALALDQYTKYLAEKVLKTQDIVVFPFLKWKLAYNPGASWGILREAGPWKHWFFIGATLLVLGILLSWLYRLEQRAKVEAIGIALIIAGAVGNLIDRLRIEMVVDFILVHYREHEFPIFNVADSAITIGVVLLFVDILFLHKKRNSAL